MAEETSLNNPWLVAVWPGMGQVAISAGYYLVAKLGMHVLAEFSPHELFEVEHVEVKAGLIQTGQLPRSRVFVWRDPDEKRDLVVFIGEAQPPSGKHAFCQKLIDFAREVGVRRVFTFAAMATQMHPEHPSRVFFAATDEASLRQLDRLHPEILEDGHIGGLNGVLLAVAAENGLPGTCLLGEMPHVFSQFPFPKASLAVMEAFTSVAHLEVDLGELAQQAGEVERRLGELLAKIERGIQQKKAPEEEEGWQPEPIDEGRISVEDERRIEKLFEEALENRSKAYALKQELDRLDVFRDYEDRFLDLFKNPD